MFGWGRTTQPPKPIFIDNQEEEEFQVPRYII